MTRCLGRYQIPENRRLAAVREFGYRHKASEIASDPHDYWRLVQFLGFVEFRHNVTFG